jgi:hypothetical protein
VEEKMRLIKNSLWQKLKLESLFVTAIKAVQAGNAFAPFKTGKEHSPFTKIPKLN